MRTSIATSLLAAGLIATTGAQVRQAERPSDSLERPFVADGRIRMDLGAGEYRITGSPDRRIRLDWSVRQQDRLSDVKAAVDVQNRDAVIRTTGPHNGFKVAIRVPSRADLRVWLTAGELKIEGIEGNKDVESHAGEIRIDVGRAEDYRRVDASVWAGEIHAEPYHTNKEGLFRSFDWSGKGPYRLHAKLKAGELHLYSLRAER